MPPAPPTRRGLPGLVWRLGRGGNWWDSKIPPLLAVAYAGILVTGAPTVRALVALGAALVAICSVAVYGHVVNDLFDVDEDRRRGKSNSMARLSPAQRSAAVGVSAGLAILPVWWAGLGPVAGGLIVVNLLLPTIYSAPPVHLKERGGLGALADAFGVHVVPAQFMLAAVTFGAPNAGVRGAALVATVGAWTVAAGLRGIISHQYADRDSDRSAGIITFGGVLSADRARLLVRGIAFPIEVAALAGLMVLVFPVAPLLLVMVTVYLGHEVLKVLAGWDFPMLTEERPPHVPAAHHHVFEISAGWFPVTLAVQLAVVDVRFIALPVLQVLLFFGNLRGRLAWVPALGRDLRNPDSRRKGRQRVRNSLERLARRSRELAPPSPGRSPNGPARFEPQEEPPLRVIVGATYWTLNGVNIFSANLVRGLRARGVDATILLTEETTALVTPDEREMPKPPDVPFEELPVHRHESWGAHWGALISYLRNRAPCVFIPNSDYRHSGVSPRLPADVVLVGVVHSDDPMHYDHVARLGRYWNAAVTTSTAIRDKVLAADPSMSDRLTTIPIGVNIPDELTPRSPTGGRPLRIIYHGVLKQYQKRILDLPRIVSACVARNIPVECTLAGGGPEEHELRNACRELVASGAVRLAGVVPHDEIFALLEQHDVYILTSEFEGMPNAMLEAMGRGCVPVVTRMVSGIPELIEDGQNGFLVPIGDIDAFCDRLAELQADPDRRVTMARAAHARVRRGAYRAETMVDGYLEVFTRTMEDARTGAFVRPEGPLVDPPSEIDGVPIFPMPLVHEEPGVGRFPTHADYRDFRERIAAPIDAPNGDATRRRVQRLTQKRNRIPVILGAPLWTRNGVTDYIVNLAQGLRERGIDARVLLTEEASDLINVDDPRAERPLDLPFDALPLAPSAGWGAHWGALIAYLERHKSCIYFPNHDWRHSCVSARLSPGVHVVGVLHGDEELHYDHARRLGAFWNAIVCSGRTIAQEAETRFPEWAEKIHTISNGVHIVEALPERPTDPAAPLRVLWMGDTGSDLAGMPAGCPETSGMVVTVVTADGGEPGPADERTPAALKWSHCPSPPELRGLYERHDVLVMRSPVESMSIVIAEAMVRGCVPVVVNPDLRLLPLLRVGSTGVGLDQGDMGAVTRALAQLAGDVPRRHEMANRAHVVAKRAAHRVDDMVEMYLSLFDRILEESARGRFVRPGGLLTPPPPHVAGTSVFPVALDHDQPGIGSFPSRHDYKAFRRRLPLRYRLAQGRAGK